MGKGGAAIVALINYVIAHQFGCTITKWLSNNVIARRQAIRERRGGRGGREGDWGWLGHCKKVVIVV